MPSDDSTSSGELKVQVERFCEGRGWKRCHNVKDLAIGVSKEAGKLLGLFQFKSPQEVEEMFETMLSGRRYRLRWRTIHCEEKIHYIHNDVIKYLYNK